MRNDPNYWRCYYARNRAAISQKRRERYRTDHEYRKKLRGAAQARFRRLRVERLKLRSQNPQAPKGRGFNKPRVLEVKGKTILLFGTGEFATRLHRDRQIVRIWEREGVLPPPTVIDSLKRRWYSESFMDAVASAVGELALRGERRRARLKKAIADALRKAGLQFGGKRELGDER